MSRSTFDLPILAFALFGTACSASSSSTSNSPAVPETCDCVADVHNYCQFPTTKTACPMVHPGEYCDPDGDGSTLDADWRRGFDEYAAACPNLNPEPLCAPGMLDCDGDPANGCEAAAAENGGTCGPDYRAVIFVDRRLYDAMPGVFDAYRTSAAAERGFKIAFALIPGADDLGFAEVKARVVQLRSDKYPAMEGVLYVGNIKLPTFYKSRTDITLVRSLPRYLEDLDGVFTKDYADGAIDPKCDDTNREHCCNEGPFTVPQHDFDHVAEGPHSGPELWAAFMPVGFGHGSNTHARFALQLKPLLLRAINTHRNGAVHNGRYYFVSGDRGEEWETTWNGMPHSIVDLYGKPGPNGETGEACIKDDGQNVCYVRWPLENYPTLAAFDADYFAQTLLDGWQEPRVLLSHLNAAVYPVVEINVHSEYNVSILDVGEARTITGGGIVVALSGCGVGGYKQPGSPSFTDVPVYVSDNIMAAYLYPDDTRATLTVFGDSFWRAHYGSYPTMWDDMRHNGTYVGLAHFRRTQKLYAKSATNLEFKENGMEFMMGDPFVALHW